MKRAKTVEADNSIEIGEDGVVFFRRSEVVTGGEGMTRVETNAETFFK